MINIRIDPEFQNKIPPLTEAEFQQLEENILSAGRVYNPIIVWNGVIVDGHNRWKVILNHPGKKIAYEIRAMDFVDKWAAFDWMYKNQLGRRNLTEEQRTYLLGKLYEARKHVHGGDRKTTKVSSAQNEHLNTGRVADQIAKEQGIGRETVKRSESFSKGIDIIRQSDPQLADEILTGQKNVSKACIQNVAKAPEDHRETFINAIRDGQPITGKKETREAKAIAKSLSDESIKMDYTIDHLIEQMRYNADGFINSLSNLIMDHRDIANQNQGEIIEAIDTIITQRVEKIKERLENGTQL